MTAKCEIARCLGPISQRGIVSERSKKTTAKKMEFTVVQMWVERPTDPWSPISPNGCERCEPWVQRAKGGGGVGGEAAVDEIESVDVILKIGGILQQRKGACSYDVCTGWSKGR